VNSATSQQPSLAESDTPCFQALPSCCNSPSRQPTPFASHPPRSPVRSTSSLTTFHELNPTTTGLSGHFVGDESQKIAPQSPDTEQPVQNTSAIFEALFNVLRNVTNEAMVQYTLALLDDLVTLEPARIADMHSPSPKHRSAAPPNAPLVLSRLLTRTDWFIRSRAAKLLSAALNSAPDIDGAIVSSFLEWLQGQLRQPSAADDSILVASGALAGLLRSREVRSESALTVPLLVRPPPPGRQCPSCRARCPGAAPNKQKHVQFLESITLLSAVPSTSSHAGVRSLMQYSVCMARW
jgi:hypothetical protein